MLLREAGCPTAYYPPEERGLSQTALNFGRQMESTVLNHIFQEFWPNIRRKVFRRNMQPAQSRLLTLDVLASTSHDFTKKRGCVAGMQAFKAVARTGEAGNQYGLPGELIVGISFWFQVGS